tara:strand:+ start:194 stop:715 length:522 start_codon:yes stop_codon:yes gene_type:complete
MFPVCSLSKTHKGKNIMDIQKTILTPFNRSLGNGAAMGALFALAIDHVIIERDTTVIVKLINAAKDKKDSQAERAIRTTFAAIFEGAKTVKVTKGISIKIKDATLSNSAVDSLKELVADGVSMRGDKWSKAFKASDEVEVELDYIKAANNLIKRGYNPLTLIAALEAALKVAA